MFAGEMMYRRIYARVVAPELVDRLLECRVCGKRPSQVSATTRFGNPACKNGSACKPKNSVARMDQIPPWVRDDDMDSVRTWTAMGGRGSGKAIDIEEPILTANRGWTTMGEICVGDVVFDERGEQCNVTSISPIMHNRNCYELTFSTSTKIVACEDHRWLTSTHSERKAARRRQRSIDNGGGRPERWLIPDPPIRTTKDIYETRTYGSRGDTNHAIQVAEALQYPDTDLPVEPYDLGVWLGDGSTHQRDVHLGDRDSSQILAGMQHINEEHEPVSRNNCHRYQMTSGFWTSIKALGLPGSKFIPRLYLESPADQRRALLAGLMDTDGYVDTGSKAELTLCHEPLALDAFDLITGLGIKATINESDATIDGRVVGRRWRICFAIYQEMLIPMRVDFKVGRIKSEGAQSARQKHRMITSIEPTTSRPVRCITVDSPNHLFLVGRELIVTHNTFTATAWFVPEVLKRHDYRMGVLGPDFGISVGVGITGPCGIKTMIQSFDPELIHKHDEQKNILTLANGSRIKSLSTENLKTIEGPEFSGYWCDELAELRGQGGDNCVWRKRAEPGIRLIGDNGEPTRKIMTGTPEATPLIKHLYDQHQQYPSAYFWTTLATSSNEANIDNVDQRYEEATGADGKLGRYGMAKLEGILILESEHALLNETELGAIRVDPSEERHRTPEQMDTVILAVDANHSDDKKSDECGIIVAGRRTIRDDSRIAHIFADASTPGGPKAWGERIIEALIAFPEIDEVVVEDDKSLVLDVLERVLRDELQKIGRPIKVVPIHHRNRSKKQRADPVAVEYQIKHVLHDPSPRMREWSLTDMEWQWVSWNPKDSTAKSPDRVDADVYAITYLLINGRASDTLHIPGR